MKRSLLVKPDWKVPIAPYLGRIGQKMTRAVHRLHAHGLAFRLDQEHILPVMFPMAGSFPQSFVVNERRLDFDITSRKEDFPHVAGKNVVKRRAFRQPEGGTRSPLVEHE